MYPNIIILLLYINSGSQKKRNDCDLVQKWRCAGRLKFCLKLFLWTFMSLVRI